MIIIEECWMGCDIMTSKFFTSIGFSVCALVFLTLVAIMYIAKRKHSKANNNSFTYLLILTIFLLWLEIFYVLAMSNNLNNVLTEILCRSYLIGAIFWLMSFLYYVVLSSIEDYEPERKNKVRKNCMIGLLVAALITSVSSCFLPIEYNKAVNDIYSFTGPASYFIYVVGFFVGAVILVLIMLKRFNFPREKKIPIYFSLIVVISSLLYQALSGYDLNNLTFLFGFLIATLFFTTESQDSKLLAEVKASKDEAEKANKSKIEFLDIISHEIRTSPSTILGFTEVLLTKESAEESLVKEDIEYIDEASVSLLGLTNNILDFSNLELNKEETEEAEYDLKDMVLEIKNTFNANLSDNKTTFEIKVDPGLPKRYYGASQNIIKIVLNILMNALKYTIYGKITLEILKNKIEDGKIEFEIIISNSGHEMKEEYLSFDFNSLGQIVAKDKNRIDSTTLGLAVATGLIDKMDGAMSFKNETGKGTKYFIYLKQKIINEDPVGNIFEDDSIDGFNNKKLDLTGKKFLLVDDTESNINVGISLLASYKATVDTATNGQECIEKAKSTEYDIIFLDYMMPEMDGVETLSALKSVVTNLPPVIALTVNASDGMNEKYLEEGFDDYLAKPINSDDLDKVINKLFNGQ